MIDTYIEDIAKTIENVKAENMEQYNTYTRSNGMLSKETEVRNIYINYLSKILNKENAVELARKFSKRLVEHITGNYDTGLNTDFENINEDAALISSFYLQKNALRRGLRGFFKLAFLVIIPP